MVLMHTQQSNFEIPKLILTLSSYIDTKITYSSKIEILQQCKRHTQQSNSEILLTLSSYITKITYSSKTDILQQNISCNKIEITI